MNMIYFHVIIELYSDSGWVWKHWVQKRTTHKTGHETIKEPQTKNNIPNLYMVEQLVGDSNPESMHCWACAI